MIRHYGNRTHASTILPDDRLYYVSCQAGDAPGFLLRRCAAPECFECIGGFAREAMRDRWYASITTPYSENQDRDRRTIGSGNRLDAIHALRKHRHEAPTKYPRPLTGEPGARHSTTAPNSHPPSTATIA